MWTGADSDYPDGDDMPFCGGEVPRSPVVELVVDRSFGAPDESQLLRRWDAEGRGRHVEADIGGREGMQRFGEDSSFVRADAVLTATRCAPAISFARPESSQCSCCARAIPAIAGSRLEVREG